MNMPSHLDLETVAWMRVQMTIAAGRAVEPLAAQLRATEDFAFGLLRVLGDVVPAMMENDPDLAAQLGPQWQQAADRFEQLERGDAVPAGESIDRLEARAQLHRLCTMRRVWPGMQHRTGKSGYKRGAA